MKRYSLLIIIIIVSGIFVARQQAKSSDYIKISGITQGTTYHITYSDNGVGNLKTEVDSLLKLFDASLSTYDSTSLISLINKNSTTRTDKLFEEVYETSQRIFDETNGYFDITVGPLVNAWGFGSAKGLNPDNHIIDSLLESIGMNKVQLKDNEIKKTAPNLQFDVNAIAQGYSVDYIAHFLDQKKIKNYMVEIGGELKVKGKNPQNAKWKIGIDKPVEGNMIAGQNLQVVMALDNVSLATSGNYRKFFVQNGVKLTHTINPHTGYTVSSNLLSVTIICDKCMDADAYATACMAMGLEKSIELIKSKKDLEAYLIFSNEKGEFEIWQTSGIQKMIVR